MNSVQTDTGCYKTGAGPSEAAAPQWCDPPTHCDVMRKVERAAAAEGREGGGRAREREAAIGAGAGGETAIARQERASGRCFGGKLRLEILDTQSVNRWMGLMHSLAPNGSAL